MTIREAKKIIERYIAANLGEYPIFYDNIEISDNMNELFIDVRITFEKVGFTSIGDIRNRRFEGLVLFDIYDLANSGTGNITGLCQTIVDLVMGIDLDGIRFRSSTMATNGYIGKWYSMSVFNSFYFDVGA